ncbi:MAG: hypothetical protein WAL02_03820, partial [Rhodoplanes sp.]
SGVTAIALLGNLAAFCRWRTSSAHVASAATSAVRASGLGSGQFNASAALCSSSPEAIAHGLTVGDGNRGEIDEPGVFTSLDRRRMTCPTTSSTAISHVSRSDPVMDLTVLRHSCVR